jgi:hypothetical protein
MTITRHHLRALALIGALSIASTACSSGGGKTANTQAQPAAATATTTTTTDPQAALRAEVLGAYGEYRHFYEQVIANPDPHDPTLAEHLAGSALSAMQRDQAGFQLTHEGERLTDVTNRSSVASIDPSGSRAVVDECVSAIAHYFDTRTGQPMGAPPLTAPTSEGFEFVFVKEAGVWKVSEKHSKPSVCQQS